MSTAGRIGLFLFFLTVSASDAHELNGTVSLERCLDVALEEHPGIAQAAAVVAVAHQRVRQVSSGFLPQVRGNYSFTRQEQSTSSLIGGPTGGAATGVCIGGLNDRALCTRDANCPGGRCRIRREVSASTGRKFNFQRTGFSFSQLVFDFGKRLYETRAAMADRDSAEAGREGVERDVVREVKTAYYDLIAARRLLLVAEETVEQTRRQLDEARSRHEVGSAPRFDVTRQEVQVADAELARLTALNDVARARENLRDAMGLSDPIGFQPDDRTLDYSRLDVDESTAIQRAYEQRPEVRDVRARMRAQKHLIASIARDYLPAVNGTGAYNWTGEDMPENESWAVGANIVLSIFNGGRTTAEVQEARAELVRLEAEERHVRQQVTLEIRRGFLDLREAEDSIRVSEKQVEQARENLEIAEGRYTTGVGNIIELTDAQVNLSRARANYVRTLADYWVSVADLERAIGEHLGTRADHARARPARLG